MIKIIGSINYKIFSVECDGIKLKRSECKIDYKYTEDEIVLIY